MRILVLLLVCAVAAVAADAPAERHAFEKELAFSGDEAAPAAAKPVSAWGAFGSFAGYAVLIVLLVCGLAVVAKKLVPGARRLAPSAAIEILGRRTIAANANLVLVQVGRRVLRLGVSKDGMTFLGEVVEPDEVAFIRGQCLGEAASVSGPAFRSTLESHLPGKNEVSPVTPPAAVSAEDTGALKTELDSIRRVVDGWRASA